MFVLPIKSTLPDLSSQVQMGERLQEVHLPEKLRRVFLPSNSQVRRNSSIS